MPIHPVVEALSDSIEQQRRQYEKHSPFVSGLIFAFSGESRRFGAKDYKKSGLLLDEIKDERSEEKLLLLLLSKIELNNPDKPGLDRLMRDAVLTLHCGEGKVNAGVQAYIKEHGCCLNARFDQEKAAIPGAGAKGVMVVCRENIIMGYARDALVQEAAQPFIDAQQLDIVEKLGCNIL